MAYQRQPEAQTATVAQGGPGDRSGAVDGENAVNNETSNPAQSESQMLHDRWLLSIHKGFDVLKHTIR